MNKCMVIAHRGAHNSAPQNTMPAFCAAVEIGCDGIETDIQCTMDEELVICHNPTIDKTSDGSGAIKNFTLDKLFNYDFGGYFSRKYTGTRIPTLHEFIEYVKDKSVRVINIEIKPEKKKLHEVVLKTIDEAKSNGVFDRLLISSFDPKILVEAKKIDENCKTAYIYPSMTGIASEWLFPPLLKAKRMKADYIHPHNCYINKLLAAIAHKMGIKINVWTVNKPSKIRKMIRLGVDGIITDRPVEVKRIITEYTK